MYPNPLRPSTPVCHFFAKEWKNMGYNVLVIHYRSMFPAIYTILARLFPALAKRYVGNHVEMDRNMKIIQSEQDGIQVYSIPIFKFFPHGKYSNSVIRRKTEEIVRILDKEHVAPDAIIGHFYNPQLDIVSRLKSFYPNAKTCVTLHEKGETIKSIIGKESKKVFSKIDIMGFRSVPIKNSFERVFGSDYKWFLCWSGTPEIYLNTPYKNERQFDDGPLKSFIYVGQTIQRKFPKQTVEGVHKAMGNMDFALTYVGSYDIGYPETKAYVDKYDLNNKVLFTGKIPRDEIINYYDNSDCFILISRDEVFGLVYLEAMSRGCIVIASRNEGMEGIIENGVNGFLCEAGNADELSDIIKRINSLSALEKQSISKMAMKTATKLSDYNVAKNYIEAVLSA